MARLSDLHLDLLTRGVLQRGEALLGTCVATSGPAWTFGYSKKTYVLVATPWRLILLEHTRALELTSMIAIPWREIDELGLVATKLQLRALTQKGPVALTLAIGETGSARRIVAAFHEHRVRPPLRLVEPDDADRTIAFMRPGVSLEGTWRLLAVEGRTGGRISSTPFGRHPVGQLVYLPNGRMSVLLMSGVREKFGSHGLGAGTLPERAAAFDSFLAYAGRYERLENRVIHYPEVASIPDFVGMPEERFVALEGDRLVLSTPPMPENGQLRTFVIVWQRVALNPHFVLPARPCTA